MSDDKPVPDLGPGALLYSVYLKVDTVKENDFTPPREVYSAVLFKDGEYVDGVSAGASPMLLKTMGKERRHTAKMTAFGQAIGGIMKILISDAAGKIVGD